MTFLPESADVVVIGAGLAGLGAALALAEAGLDVQVLEAEPRVGGRIRTIRQPFSDDLYAEAGGEFVDDAHEAVHHLLDRYGLVLRDIPWARRLFRFGGTLYRGSDLSDLGDGPAQDQERLDRESAKLAARIANPRQPWTSASDLDGRSVGDWLDDLGLGPVARTYQQTWRSVDYGVAPQHISLLQYARDEHLWNLPVPPRPSGRLRGGMDQLPVAMAHELGDRVHLETPVTSICQDASSVRVGYAHGDNAGSLRARFAVLAIPIPAVRRLVLNPPPDPDTRLVLDRLAYGRIVKVLIQVRRRVWEDHGLSGRTFTDGMVQATYETTAGQSGERAILTVYTADRSADALGAMSDEQRVAACVAELDTLYPGFRAEVEQAVSARWDASSRAGGAYSHFRPREMALLGSRVARPFGQVHVAGEHTDPWQATMNGALTSGLRAAHEILERVSS